MTFVCEFDRIGRNRDVPSLAVETDDAQEVAEAVYRHARRFLGSSGYDVIVNLDEGRGSIEFGRFGTFTITHEMQPAEAVQK